MKSVIESALDEDGTSANGYRDGEASSNECRRTGCASRREVPLGAQRRAVGRREDVLCGNRNVFVVRKPGVM